MVANCMKTSCKSSDLILFGYKQLWRQYFQKFSDIWFMGLWLQSTNKKLHTLELEHGVQLDRLSMVEYLLVYQIPSNSGSRLCVQSNMRDMVACSNSKL